MNTVTLHQAPPTVDGDFAPRPTASVPAPSGYEVLELVGRGGMGKVFRARHLELNRMVAIKVLAHEPDERQLTRFLDEGRVVARLRHPNIVQLYDLGLVDGRPYLAQEFVDGGTLGQKFANVPQDPKFAAEVVETIARAIQCSHDHGILHRDLKPGNVLLMADGTPKVTDFGLAKVIQPAGSTAEEASALTRTGEILGTPSYMPPEQASGITSTLGPAADVYALGAILYEALTGRPPFQSPEPLQTVLLVLSMDPVAPRALLPKIPKDLETICLKCLEKSPKARYATAAALADDLRRWRTGEPIVARPVGLVERVGKWARRKKAQAALVLVTGLLVLALLGLGVLETLNAGRLRRANDELAAKNEELARVNADLAEAKLESDKSYGLATSALDGVVRDVSLRLNGVPRAEAVLLDVIARSSDLYGQLRAVRPADPAVASSQLSALVVRLSYESNYGRYEAADRTRKELTEVLRGDLAAAPDRADLRRIELRLAFDAATAAQATGHGNRADKARTEYVRLVDHFAEQFPSHPDLPKIQVEKHWLRGFSAAYRKDANARADALRDSVAAAKTITDPRDRFTFLSTSLSQLGMVLQMANRLDEAEQAFVEVQAVYEQASRDPRDSEAARAGLATTRMHRGSIALNRGQFRAALELYQAAEPVARGLVGDFPLTRIYRLTLSQCLFDQALIYRSTDLARCRALADEAVAVLDTQLKQRPDATDREIRDGYASFRDSLPKPTEKK